MFLILIIKTFFDRKIIFKDGWIQRLVCLFLIIIGISTLLSKNLFLSFWGGVDQTDSFLFLIVCVLIFFLSVNTPKRRDVINILECFIGGSAVLSILFFIQNFAAIKMGLFDSLQPSAIVISLALTTLVSFIFNNINYFRGSRSSFNIIKIASAGVFFILFIMALFLMDFKISWFFVSIGMFFVFWRSIMENNFDMRSRRSLLSLVFLVVFLSLFFLPNQLNSNTPEPRLSYSDSWNIAEKTMTANTKDFFLGTGPSTFAYQFSLYKDKDLNQIGLGSLIFDQGSIPVFTFLATTGLLGMLSLLSIILVFYFQGFRYFLSFKRGEKDFSINVNDILFPVVFSSSLLLFFYKIDAIALIFIFLPLGLWVGQQRSDETVIEIADYSKNIARTVFTLIFIILLFVIFNFVNYYRSEVLYEKAVDNFKAGGDITESISSMEKASQIWKTSDNYISLSQLYLIQASQVFTEKWTTKEKQDEQKQEIKNLVLKAEGIANFACNRDPNNFQSWQNLGLVYENTNYLTEDRTDDALSVYAKAENLAPQNEDIYLAEGRLLEIKGENAEALVKYEKAFELNPMNSTTAEKIKELKGI